MNIAVYLVNKNIRGWSASEDNINVLREKLPECTINCAKTAAEFVELLAAADAALTWQYKDEWVEMFPNVRIIGTPAAGADYLPSNIGDNISIIHGSFHGYTMSETAIGMMLDHVRRIRESDYRMQHGEEWPRAALDNSLRSLTGAHVAILGFGAIGEITAKRLKAFDCKITGIKRKEITKPAFFAENDCIISVDSFMSILPSVDHLISFLPDNEQTDDLISLEVFKLLPDHAALYSLGRGNSVSEEDLIYALNNNLIAGAYLDVYKVEPLPLDSPLRGVDKLCLLPHSSAISPDYMKLFFDELPAKLLKLL